MNMLPGPQLVLVIIDGLGDRKYKSLRNKTPLEAAKTPVMDKMVRNGMTGFHFPMKPGIPVGSGIAHNLLFGYDLDEYPGRGVIESLGMDFKLEKDDLCFRVNFATMGNRDIVLDRRAGRDDKYLVEITKEVNLALKKNPFRLKIILKHSCGHRGALVVKKWKKGVDIPDMDPQIKGLPLVFPKKGPELKLMKWLYETTKKVMNKSEFNRKRKKHGLKPANGLLLRGAGKYIEVESLGSKIGLKTLGIARESLYLGAARFAGMKTMKVEVDEDKIPTALKYLHDFDFFFIHFKKTDTYGHDGKLKEKVKEIEKIDGLLKILLNKDNLAIAITGDHATPCSLKTHSGDKVPVLFYGTNVTKDRVKKFGESYSLDGGAGQLTALDIIPMLANMAGRMPEIGK